MGTLGRAGRPAALITGVGRKVGIGAGIAARLADDGWDLGLSYWRPYDADLSPDSLDDEPEHADLAGRQTVGARRRRSRRCRRPRLIDDVDASPRRQRLGIARVCTRQDLIYLERERVIVEQEARGARVSREGAAQPTDGVEPQQVGGVQEHVAFDRVRPDGEEVERAIELIDGDPLGLRQPGDIKQPARGTGQL